MATKKMPVSRANVRLSRSMFLERFSLNRSYIMSLTDENLVQNFTFEAALSGWATYNNQFGRPMACTPRLLTTETTRASP